MSSKRSLTHRKERGIALLIAIFSLLLISGVAVALIVSARTEVAIAANYRASTQSFFAAYAGLEEGRGRLFLQHPNFLGTFITNPVGTPLAVNQVRYIINPSAGEVVNPLNLVPNNPFADTQYTQEWGLPVTTRVVTQTASVPAVPGLPNAEYKWVRITAKTEASAGIDVDNDGVLNATDPLFFDGQNQYRQPVAPSGSRQVMRITALSVLPNGSRRILQYDAAPVVLNLTFPGALTFDGSGAYFDNPSSNVYTVTGHDQAYCGNPQASVPGIAVLTPADDAAVTTSILGPPNRSNQYTGSSGGSPSVDTVTMPPWLQDPSSIEQMMQQIQNNATNYICGNICDPSASVVNGLSAAQLGSPSSPTITFVDGDLTLSGNAQGTGILVVTGTLTTSGTVGWDGIVLVIGQGEWIVNGGGNNSYEGAVVLAKTKDPAGNLLPVLGPTSLDWSGGGGNGVHYDSCHINNANSANAFMRVLSFREITQ
jgi:hypothetical protein